MDNFIDKFAQRKNAQEMIKANAMAEAEEKEKLTVKLSEYELAIQEMRRCNLQNLESSEKIKELLAASLSKVEEVQKKEPESDKEVRKAVEEMRSLLEALKGQVTELLEGQQVQMTGILEKQQERQADLLKEQIGQLEEQKEQIKETIEAQQKTIEEQLHASEEFNHKEAVKVYRNVQAVIEGALPKQTEEIGEMIKNTKNKKGVSVWLIVIGVLTFAAAAANTVIEILRILGQL